MYTTYDIVDDLLDSVTRIRPYDADAASLPIGCICRGYRERGRDGDDRPSLGRGAISRLLDLEAVIADEVGSAHRVVAPVGR